MPNFDPDSFEIAHSYSYKVQNYLILLGIPTSAPAYACAIFLSPLRIRHLRNRREERVTQ